MHGCPTCAWFKSGAKPMSGMTPPEKCSCLVAIENDKRTKDKDFISSTHKQKEINRRVDEEMAALKIEDDPIWGSVKHPACRKRVPELTELVINQLDDETAHLDPDYSVGFDLGEMPKKKMGRPKKVKHV